jgi:hypothetical protein
MEVLFMSALKDLSTEEKAKSYSKYYYMKPAVPDPGMLEAMEKPIDPSKALPIERLNDLLNPGYLDVEAGYCCLPNGAAFVANHTLMPGVTVEMIHWWFAWHSLEDLRYKIWWPVGHFAISIGEEDHKKVLDPQYPAPLKFQGITHHVVEDVGGGTEDIFINFLTPEDMGFDMTRFKSPNVGTIVAANGVSSPIDAPSDAPKAPAVMCHFIREIPDGVEFRTRFWMGYHMIDKKPKLLLPPGAAIPEEVPKGLAIHNVFEYSNLLAILPQIYEEQKGVIN